MLENRVRPCGRRGGRTDGTPGTGRFLSRKRARFPAIVVALWTGCLTVAGSGAYADAFRIDLPVDCVPGVDCFVQNYPDVDPTPSASDHACGQMTYNGHSGTDFRVRNHVVLQDGVTVTAVASGTVTRVRDGEPDAMIPGVAVSVPEGRGCGNGLVIDHGEGWSTQYCHLRADSVRPAVGDRVKRGEALGLIGMSGRTEFPHLEFIVRKGETVLDPFTRLSLEAGCGADGAPLWTDAAALALGYRTAAILNAGFAPGTVANEDIEAGRFDEFRLEAETPALVFYGRAIGLVAGDVEVIEIRDPDGEIFVSHVGEPLDRAKAQKMLFAGRKVSKSGWKQGTYTGIYRVLRSGWIVSETSRSVRR